MSLIAAAAHFRDKSRRVFLRFEFAYTVYPSKILVVPGPFGADVIKRVIAHYAQVSLVFTGGKAVSELSQPDKQLPVYLRRSLKPVRLGAIARVMPNGSDEQLAEYKAL